MEDIDVKPRRCLKCLQDFLSQGPGNRICGECRRKHKRLFNSISEAELQAQRGRKYHNGERMELEDEIN